MNEVMKKGVKTKEDSIVVKENVNDVLNEAFRSLRTNLQFLLQDKGKVVMFTSTKSGEGKTFVSSNFAISQAVLGKKVLLMGLDIRRPRLADVFNITKQKMSNQIETTNSLNRTFKINIQHISNEYKLQCSIINNSNNEETKIKIQDKEEYSLQFTLDGNNIDFMNDLINSPEEYKLYSIHYFKKEYQVVAEVLFALILDEIVKKINKK